MQFGDGPREGYKESSVPAIDPMKNPGGKYSIVLLSDGYPTIGFENREVELMTRLYGNPNRKCMPVRPSVQRTDG